MCAATKRNQASETDGQMKLVEFEDNRTQTICDRSKCFWILEITAAIKWLNENIDSIAKQ